MHNLELSKSNACDICNANGENVYQETCIHSSTVGNGKLETTKCPTITEYINIVHSYNEMGLSNEMSELLPHATTWPNVKT